jgi:Fe-S-cluster-containing dehydrogenase component/formate-dependent nitrite reductase membrane component NrfD
LNFVFVMPSLGFVIDNRKCIGCHACTVACKSENNVPLGVDRTWVKYIEKGTFPNNRRLFTVMRCNHCEEAPCVTICPVTALYVRDDGAVDFNNERCIGCKGCLQACPYDALYIDPESNTAAKCNFCSHRLEVGLQPSCVIVCPEQAIIAGDLADPQSEISLLIARHQVQVRKPEKGTRPKLFYIEADEASLVPSATAAGQAGLWNNGESHPGSHSRQSLPILESSATPRRVYDAHRRPAAWGWEVVGYTWTKSIATGCFLAIIMARTLFEGSVFNRIAMGLGLVCEVFLALTALLLVADLKQPRRFLYVLLRPQWRSWLVRGAYILTAFGALVTAWLVAQWIAARGLADILLLPGAILAALAAVYTAFLFAQAKGRDLWQSPLLSLHLLAHALVAGAAVWLIMELVLGAHLDVAIRWITAAVVSFSLIVILSEIMTTPASVDAHRALQWIVGPPMGTWFWLGGIVAGHALPLMLLMFDSGAATGIAAVLALGGLLIIEWLWVLAPQQIPLS